MELRGFKHFVHGRLCWEAPVIIQRLCGICPVSHLLFGFEAPVAKRNVIGVAMKYQEVATRSVLRCKFGQEIIKATAAKKYMVMALFPGR